MASSSSSKIQAQIVEIKAPATTNSPTRYILRQLGETRGQTYGMFDKNATKVNGAEVGEWREVEVSESVSATDGKTYKNVVRFLDAIIPPPTASEDAQAAADAGNPPPNGGARPENDAGIPYAYATAPEDAARFRHQKALDNAMAYVQLKSQTVSWAGDLNVRSILVTAEAFDKWLEDGHSKPAAGRDEPDHAPAD